MDYKNNIRSMSVIAHVDHGASRCVCVVGGRALTLQPALFAAPTTPWVASAQPYLTYRPLRCHAVDATDPSQARRR